MDKVMYLLTLRRDMTLYYLGEWKRETGELERGDVSVEDSTERHVTLLVCSAKGHGFEWNEHATKKLGKDAHGFICKAPW